MEQPKNKMISLAQKDCEGFHLNDLKNFPQFRQKFSNRLRDILHFEQGAVSFVLEKNCTFRIFSDAKSVSSIPTNVRRSPAAVWNTSIATSSPKR